MVVHLIRRGGSESAKASAVEPKPVSKNRRNGHSRKTVCGEMGEITLELPPEIARGTFEPQLIPKHQRRLSGFDENIQAQYAKGLSTRSIQEVVQQFSK